MNFNEKIVLITGASSGIGSDFAIQLHAKGAKVILVARRRDKLEELSNELNLLRENSSEFITADLTNSTELKKVTDYIRSNRVDILINNAGFGSLGYFENIDIAHETKMVSLNITSTLETLNAVIPQMKQRREGAIISISSVAAFLPMPFMATYASTKAFNFYHSMALRSELSDFNIKVLTVCPGPTATEFFGAAHLSGMAKSMKRDLPENVVNKSIAALVANKAYIVTGIKAKALWLLAKFTPYCLSSRIIKYVFKDLQKAV